MILEVGNGKPSGEVVDLGDVALLPRLLNAHTHLEFSDHQKPVGYPGIAFSEWLKLVISTRVAGSPDQKSKAILAGSQELWNTGTVLAAEITTPPVNHGSLSGEVELASFAEVLGLHPSRFAERLTACEEHVSHHPLSGFSPHAPYSISSRGLELVFEHAAKTSKPIAMHVAESTEERELLTTGKGPMADFLNEMGLNAADHFPWHERPFERLIHRFSGLNHVFLVHGNDLNETEIQQLANYPQITVVYCPRTHHFFRFATHPIKRLVDAGVRVVLGTDSRASNPDLDLWKEVQFVLQHHQEIEPNQVIAMGTRMPAEAFRLAFGIKRPWGALSTGFSAQMGMVRTSADNHDQLFRDLSSNGYQNFQLS